MSTRLCLGTAAFGLNYGVTNASGTVALNEARKIIKTLGESPVEFLDTAQSYGDAEAKIGRLLTADAGITIISKLKSFEEGKAAEELVQEWELGLEQSLQRLRRESLGALLVHGPSDLKGAKGELLTTWLKAKKAEGLVKKIGASIYDANDLEGVSLNMLDIVQLPVSLYDQRLIKDGTIGRLKSNGVEVHGRSLFLQGLILVESSKWPQWIPRDFAEHHRLLEMYGRENAMTLQELALSFAVNIAGLDVAVVGVTNKSELDQLIKAWDSVSGREWIGDPHWWFWEKDDILDPRKWER